MCLCDSVSWLKAVKGTDDRWRLAMLPTQQLWRTALAPAVCRPAWISFPLGTRFAGLYFGRDHLFHLTADTCQMLTKSFIGLE